LTHFLYICNFARRFVIRFFDIAANFHLKSPVSQVSSPRKYGAGFNTIEAKLVS
jgi:hypothetical protein